MNAIKELDWRFRVGKNPETYGEFVAAMIDFTLKDHPIERMRQIPQKQTKQANKII